MKVYTDTSVIGGCLTKMDKEIKIDAVQMMRDIREKLSEKYWKNPDILKKEMEVIRQKYHLNFSTQK